MDSQLKNRLFLIGGATAGFGNAVAKALIREGADVIAVARNTERLTAFATLYPGNVEALGGDITDSETITAIIDHIGERKLDGILVNAGGPPATRAEETSMEMWDTAYFSMMRWKLELVMALLPKLKTQRYGRILFIESVAVYAPEYTPPSETGVNPLPSFTSH